MIDSNVMELPDRVRDRFWDRVETGPPDECWAWRLSTGSHGYGQVGWSEGGKTRMVLTHRVAWFLTNGPIPADLTVDHVCRNRVCCNPAHLRLLTNLENAKDNGMARKTHCLRGHPFDEKNTYRNARGHRFCRACRRERRL